MKVVRTIHGAQLVHGEDVLSEVRETPGPTHSLWDLLAAAISAGLADEREATVGLLGFAGGGLIAPFRAMGHENPIAAVDRSRQGTALFRRMSQAWCGDVTVDIEDAQVWLARRRRPFSSIVEDLSVAGEGGHVKPPLSIDVLPKLIARKLKPSGCAIFNLLPSKSLPFSYSIPRVVEPFDSALSIHTDEFENRLIVVSQRPLDARGFGRTLRRALDRIGSRQKEETRVRTIRTRA